MWLICPDCGRKFKIPNRDIWWLADAIKRNPKLQIICSRCGRILKDKLDRLNGLIK